MTEDAIEVRRILDKTCPACGAEALLLHITEKEGTSQLGYTTCAACDATVHADEVLPIDEPIDLAPASIRRVNQ